MCALIGRIDAGNVREYWTDLQKQLAMTILVGSAMGSTAMVPLKMIFGGFERCVRMESTNFIHYSLLGYINLYAVESWRRQLA